MANTYSQIFLHFVFAVKKRKSLLSKEWRTNVFKYMSEIATRRGHKVIQINGVEDHVHILLGLNPDKSPSETVRDMKSHSSQFIHKERFLPERFEWQRGYGVFSYHKSMIPTVAGYIERQEEHHRKRTFRDEYISMLGSGDEPFTVHHFFEWIDDE